jgi:sulfotransferase family protein
MDVIGVGFGRTGTLSLKAALERTGFGPCLHMVPLLDDAERSMLLCAAADGDAVGLDKAFDGFRSSVDWPGTYFWRELTTRHPTAKVILTVRDSDGWYESAARTIYEAANSRRGEQLSPERAACMRMLDKLIWQGTFDGRFGDRADAIRRFEEHNAAVRAEIAPERLLEFRVGAGWEPLCEFLGVPVPAEPFPRLNDQAAFAERARRFSASPHRG